jgi:uncharacterized protein (DUF342 family)
MQGISGTLTVELDDSLLSATLTCTTDSEGEEWSPERIVGFLREEGLSWTRDQEGVVLDAVKSLQGLEGGSRSVLLFEGRPPGETIDGRVEWAENALPQDFTAEAERILASAPPPRVYETRVSREKVEEIQTKKAPLPFLRPKEEKTVRWVRREERIEIGVDPKPESIGYVEEGGLLATLRTGQKGADGRNVRGEPISARAPVAPRVLLGEGVSQKGNEIRADISGFVRRGRNWLDVVAYREHSVRIYSSEDHSTCLLDFDPGNAVSPDVKPFFDQAADLGFPAEELIGTEELRGEITRSLSDAQPLLALSLSRSRDSSFAIEVADDRLRASITLHKGSGAGRPLSLKEVGQAINGHGFKGMDLDMVRKAILAFHRGSARELVEYVLVEGTAPERGSDARVDWCVDFLDETRAGEVAERLSGVPDSARLAFVLRGQPVADIVPAGEGTPGRDVFGSPIPAVRGSDPDLKVDESLTVSGEVVTATRDGVLEVSEEGTAIRARVVLYEEKQVAVIVDDLKMSAFVRLRPGTGQTISEQEIRDAIKAQGVVKGIDEESLELIIKRATAGEEVPETVFARGQEPVHELAGRLQFQANVETGRSFLIDGETGEKLQVKAGDVIAEILPSERQTRPGFTVLGEEIAARRATEVEIRAGENVDRQVDDDGHVRFVAERGGEVFYDGELLAVKDTRTVDGDVGTRTGNIQFSGSLTISGGVQNGAKVFSGGDIHIAGVVQQAVVSSEGSIGLEEGVKGRGKAILRAKNDIEATYLEQARVRAVGDIRVKNSCLSCDVRCNNQMSLTSEKAALVGGRIKAKKGVETGNLGSAKQVRTELSFGQDYLVQDRIEVAQREIEKIRAQIARIDAWLGAQAKKPTGQVTAAKVDEVRRQKVRALKLTERLGIRLFNLHEKFEAHFASEVVVRGTLYPGVVFESHGRTHEVDSEQSGVRVRFDTESGRIVVEPL